MDFGAFVGLRFGNRRMTLTEFSKFIQELRRSNTDPMAEVGVSIGGNKYYDMDEVLFTITDRKGRIRIHMDEIEEEFDGTLE